MNQFLLDPKHYQTCNHHIATKADIFLTNITNQLTVIIAQ